MEPQLETIDLDVEEVSELLFKVKVEGMEPAPAKVRLVCEAGDVAYMFNGHPTSDDGVVQFLLPVLKDKIKEGLYQSRVEVLIENRYFAPVQFNINFKKAMTVVAEAVQVPQRRSPLQVSVTAEPIIVLKKQAPAAAVVSPPPSPSPKPIVVEEQMKSVVQQPKQPQIPAIDTSPKSISTSTLKERYHNKHAQREEVVEVNEASEDLLKELARGFIRLTKKR